MVFSLDLITTGLWTGLIATIIMTIGMMIGKATGMAPMDIILMLGRGALGEDAPEQKARMIGMLKHFTVGLFFGVLYQLAVANQIIFTSFNISSGMIFSLIPWLVMMLMLMPMMGMGIFGMKKSPKVLVMTLLLHLVYGASLGYMTGM